MHIFFYKSISNVNIYNNLVLLFVLRIEINIITPLYQESTHDSSQFATLPQVTRNHLTNLVK